MVLEAVNSFPDPFLAHLILILSIYELGPSPSPIPSYDGPSTWQTDHILRTLKTMAHRMYSAEHTILHSANLASPDGTTASSYPNITTHMSSGLPHRSSSPPSFPPHSVTSLATDVERKINMSASGSDRERSSYAVQLSDRAVSPIAFSAPPTSHGDLASRPPFGTAGSDKLVNAAFESDMGTVEELRFVKTQMSDVARVCNAVARGDLSQRITVHVQGAFMVQLKDVINGMVDKLDQFAREVTRVSQEVGAQGYLSSPPTRPSHGTSHFASVNSAARLLYWTSMVYGLT
jgi:osomolarity two-component system, sensor histidine kinase NIK1